MDTVKTTTFVVKFKTMKSLGEKLEPILIELEGILGEHDILALTKPNYTDDGFRAVTRLFLHVLLDKMYSLQDIDGMSIDQRCDMANKCGGEFRKLIKTYCDIDTFELFKQK